MAVMLVTPDMDAPLPSGQPSRLAAFQRKHRTGLVTLVFTDLVDSVALRRQLGDQASASLLQAHRQLVRQTLARFTEAEEIETAGDSFLLLFARPSDAVRFALVMQRQARSLAQARGVRFADRIGIHVGEVVIEEHEEGPKPKDVYGAQLDLCARVMGLAEGGQILLTRAVFDSARQALKGEDLDELKALNESQRSNELSWLNHGEYSLKGFDEAVEVGEVGEVGLAPLKAPPGSEKAQRRVNAEDEPVLGWRPAVGQWVPNTRWQLEQKLGEGGFGEVWLGRNPATKEARVFKFCFHIERVRFLKRELTLFRVLKERVGDHPNIVRLHDVYLDQPPFYVEMDYVEGKDLRTWCEERGGVGSVPLETRLAIVAQAAEALQAAHDAGVIHRDVKPANILIAECGLRSADSRNPKSEFRNPELIAKLTDFGIGQVVSEEALQGITRAGFTQTILSDSSTSHTGTQLYMAPELLAGKPASTRSDIYSLGVVLYQLLVGDFTRPVTMDWGKGVADPLLRADLERCFAGDPEERFAGAAELSRSLRHIDQRRTELQRRQAELTARERAAYRRGIVRTSIAAVLVIANFILLALFAFQQARRANINAKVLADRQRELKRNLYVSDMGLAWQAIQHQEVGRARELVERYLHRQPWEEDLRGFEWRLLWQRSLTNYYHSFNEHVERAKCAVFSPDGSQLATASDDKTVMVWDVNTKKRVRTFSDFDDYVDFRALTFSHNGKFLAAKGGTQLRVWRTDTWQEIATLSEVEPNDNGNNAVVFSPDDSTLATRAPTNGKNGVSFWATGNWQRTGLFFPETKPLRGGRYSVIGTVLAYSNEGQLLAVSDWHELQIRDARQPTRLIATLARSPADEEARVFSVAFSAKYVAVGYRDGIIVLWKRETWEQQILEKVAPSFLTALAFSPDSSLLAAGSSHVVGVWDVQTLVSASSGKEVVQPRITLRGHTRGITAVAFTPDGRTLASASSDGTVKLWKLDQDSDEPKLAGSRAPVGFSNDGKVFAAFHVDGRLHLWDVQPRRDRGPANVAVETNNAAAVALAPSGGQLAVGLTNGNVQLWQLSEPPVLSKTLIGDGNPVVTLGYSPEVPAHSLAVVSHGGSEYRYHLHSLSNHASARLLSAESGRTRWSVEQSFAFSPDGKLVAVINAGRGVTLFNVWDGESDRVGTDLELSGSVAFSPDGSFLAASHDAKAMVWAWDVKSGRLRWSLATGSGFLSGLAFSPDGKTLLTRDADNLARFWNVALRKEILTMQNFRQGSGHTGFSPNGNALALLASRQDDDFGRIELYTVPTLVEIDAAEKAR